MTDVLDQLVELSQRGRLPHGMLFVGSDREMKRKAVVRLAQYLFCSTRSGLRGCGRCLSCGKVERGNHPDLLSVSTEEKEIRIESIRDWARWLNVGPNEATQKIGVIEDADLLNPFSSNALLKTLEEPPAHALIILLARSAANILPTVRSRLMQVRFPRGLSR